MNNEHIPSSTEGLAPDQQDLHTCEEGMDCCVQKKKTPFALILILILLFFGAGTAFGYYLMTTTVQTETEPVAQDDTFVDADTDISPVDDSILVIDWIPVLEQTLVDTPQDIIDRYFISEDIPFDETEDDWYRSHRFSNDQLSYFSSHQLSLIKEGSTRDEDYMGYHTFLLGSVAVGPYKGSRLVLSYAGYPSMGTEYLLNYFLIPEDANGDSVLLDRYSVSIGTAFSRPTKNETEHALSELIVPELEDPEAPWLDEKGNTHLYQGTWYRNDFPFTFQAERYPTLTSANGMLLYEFQSNLVEDAPIRMTDHGFFYTRVDGRTVWFDMEVPFWTSPYDTTDKGPIPPEITWNGGVINDQFFTKGALGGCGMSSYSNVVDISEVGNLSVAGTYTDREIEGMVYEPDDKNTEDYQTAYANATLFDDSVTWDDFIALHPFFYWQDGLGRWIKFTNTSVLPAAECGKPVIYLYPETVTDIDVSIDLKGGMSKSEPAYNEGWSITAFPNGTLVNHADNQLYPYLFWEGKGDFYVSPQTFWVVEQNNVEPFLIETLATLGLNTKETADFLEFWLPLMQEFPYYQIGFHGTQAMNQIAPLTLSEKPDMLLRILMDYTGLEAPIAENPPVLPPTPKRHGFSVIEWGGILR